MDIEKFAEEMITSQTDGELTEYVLKHWGSVLEVMPSQNNDMDILIELASNVGETRGLEELEKYQKFIDGLKPTK